MRAWFGIAACCAWLAACSGEPSAPADDGAEVEDATADAAREDPHDAEVRHDAGDVAPDLAPDVTEDVPPDVAPVCGDGVVQGDEDCDRGDENGGAVCAWDCTDAAPFVAFDQVITDLMERHGVPGGAVAVSVRGRLVLVRGYGTMDPEGSPMNPLARFRIASISKPITAAAVMLLVQRGELSLDERAFEILGELLPPEGTPARDNVDPRLMDITVRHLLWHTGGWDRGDNRIGPAYDPMFIPGRVSAHLGVPSPPEPEDIARYMTEQPLNFTPGERYAYSNFGYSLLGRIIEARTGRGYEAFVREEVLAPQGADAMRIGASRLDRAAADEPYYFPTPGREDARSVFDEDGNPQVPTPYGAWYQQSLDSHGGWISSTVDLLRFSLSVDGFDSWPDLLDADHHERLTARPDALFPEETSASYYYSMGWSVRVISPERQNRWHTGALPGTATILVRTADDVHWVALYNHRPASNDWWLEMDQAMWEAAGTVSEWPEHDLFTRHQTPAP